VSATTQFLIKHGLPFVFGLVFLEPMGLPLPAPPLLMAAGARAATGQFSLPFAVLNTFLELDHK
jgi:membrane protein DedA with SNARE-associated domain